MPFRNVTAQPALLAELVASGDLERAFADGELRARIAVAAEACADEAALKTALRQLRRREMVRIAWRDLAVWADLAETLASLSALADACIDAAQARLAAWLTEREGVPRDPGGAPAAFVVLGMGKLGGGALNFSSDIDLIFAYSDEGETDRRGLSNHEYFVRLGQRLITVLNEATGDVRVPGRHAAAAERRQRAPGTVVRRHGAVLPGARPHVGTLRAHQGALRGR